MSNLGPSSAIGLSIQSSEPRPEREHKHHLGKVRIVLFIAVIVLAVSAPVVLLSENHPAVLTGGGGGGPGALQLYGGYGTLHSLKGNSTIVVLVTVGPQVASYPIQNSSIVEHIFQLNVSSYIKGSGPATVYLDDVALPGSPLPVTSQQYVFFLINNWVGCEPPDCPLPPTPLDQTYFATGGAQGKFLVLSGLVYGFKTLYAQYNSHLHIDASGVALETFLSEVRDA